jgi:hypothetical protein
MTAHVSSDEADEYIPGCLDIFFENVGRMRSGDQLINVLDISRGY